LLRHHPPLDPGCLSSSPRNSASIPNICSVSIPQIGSSGKLARHATQGFEKVGEISELFVSREGAISEVGTLGDTLKHRPQTILLSRQYANPVVFAQPLSRDSAQTAVVRIKEVQSDRFTL
jgi:hypothetical protein